MNLDVDALEAAGLYDPAAPDAAERLDLLRYLAEQGATVGDMADAEATGNLSSLALDLAMRRGPLDAAELAARSELTVDEVLETYRLLGITVADPAERRFTDAEVGLLQLADTARSILPEDTIVEILRSVGDGMAVIAESEVSAFVGTVEDVLEAGVPRDRAETTLAAGQLALQLGHHLEPLLRHHIIAATDRQRTAMIGAVDRRSSRLAVGFVDLVGFTSATAAMSADELLAFVQDFRSRTYDVVTGVGGRVVKHIGDEIMFSAGNPADACRIALGLVAEFGDDDAPPRGGLAHGVVVARHGDLYGPVVNLAARLADVAVPGEVLADRAIVDAIAAAATDPTGPTGTPGTPGALDGLDGLAFEPAGRRQLKGFDVPVPVVTVLPG